MFVLALVRRCAKQMTQLPRLKVKVAGQIQWIYPLISYLFHISCALLAIFIKLHPNVLLNEIVSRAHNPAT